MTKIHQLRDFHSNCSWNKVEKSGMIELISHYNLVKVLTSLYKINILEKLKGQKPIKPDTFKSFDQYLLGHVFQYLEVNGVFTSDDAGYYLTDYGEALLSDVSIAQMGFYSEAYENITTNIDKFLKNEITYGSDIIRDGKSLGIHCDTLFKEYHTASVLEALNSFNARKILDIGCGGGQFLTDAARKATYLTGIGIDIAPDAIKYAQESVVKNNLEDRLKFVVADAFDLKTWPLECFNADVLTGSGVVHEHFRDGEDAVINILNTYSELLTNHGFKAIILGEPEIRYDLVKNDQDLYLVHIFTAQGFPRHREQWLELFTRTKLHCENVYTRPFAGPRFNFFVLTLKH